VITITPPARWLCDALGMQTNDHQQDWRARAQEMRALGDQMHDQLAREEMLRLANKFAAISAVGSVILTACSHRARACLAKRHCCAERAADPLHRAGRSSSSLHV
jgi:hypothetical protein